MNTNVHLTTTPRCRPLNPTPAPGVSVPCQRACAREAGVQ
jgi:hypothetical protein